MYKVLLVDDESEITDGLKILINWSEYGFTTIDTADNGDTALLKLKSNKYNLIITDIRMPGINGLELIKSIRTLNQDIKIIIISGYNEFAYAQHAIQYNVSNYLLKPISKNELIENVTQIAEGLKKEMKVRFSALERTNLAKDRFLSDFSCGNLTEKEILVKSPEYSLQLFYNSYRIAIVEVQSFINMVEKSIKEAKLLIFAVKNIVEEIIANHKLGYVYDEHEGHIGIILCGEGCNLEADNIEQVLQQIITCNETYLQIKPIISYGNIVYDFMSVKLSRSQAISALHRKFLLEGINIIPFNKVDIVENIEFDYSGLLLALETHQSEQIGHEIDKLFKEVVKKYPSKDVLYGIVYSVVFQIAAIIKNSSGNAELIFQQQQIRNFLETCTNLSNLKVWLNEICQKACRYLIELNEVKSDTVISQIKTYIDENYSMDLSLKTISNVFYLNPCYLGRLFKNTLGQPFNDYLNCKRIAEAKKLLCNPNYKIQEIISKVGYNNAEYFYRQFKRYEGISFAEYNESIRSKRK